jgi:Flp pilus assembly protein TadG
MNWLNRYWRDEFGGGAAEFAIVLLPFAALIFAIIHLSLMFYANQNLQFAAEAAARCYSVDAVACSTPGAAQTYATGRYTGPSITPVFVAAATGCGHTVNGSGSYQLNAVFVNVAVPLAATACFP